MYLGVPCAIAEGLGLAELFREHGLGLTLSPDPEEAANSLREALAQPARLQEWSAQAQVFARERFHPRAVASGYLNLYGRVLAQ